MTRDGFPIGAGTGSALNWKASLAILLVGCVALSGCASFRKKFARPAPPSEVTSVYSPQEFTQELTHAQLYHNHFTFWQGWMGTLADELDGTNRKAVLYASSEALGELTAMRRYLVRAGQGALDPYIDRLRQIHQRLGGQGDVRRYEQEVSALRLAIEKRFAPKQVQEWMIH